MSILIKGIEMPKSCLICVCDIPKGNCDLWRNQTPEEHRRERHPDCPLVEVPKHGEWIVMNDDFIDDCKCSECGCIEYFNKGWKRFNFCPNCGADMRGDSDV